MEIAVWIALISASGVVLAAGAQWLSNRNTLQAAQAREVAVREDQEQRLRLDYEERARERAHTTVLGEIAARAALSETWREHRLVAHRDALTALDKAFAELERFRSSWETEFLHGRSSLPPSELFDAVGAASADVGLFCSSASSNAFQIVTSKMNMYMHLVRLEDFISQNSSEPISPTPDMLQSRRKWIVDIGDALQEYRHEAKSDLGTLD